MKACGLKVLDESEEEAIHRGALSILSEVGVLVESPKILERLGAVERASGARLRPVEPI